MHRIFFCSKKYFLKKPFKFPHGRRWVEFGSGFYWFSICVNWDGRNSNRIAQKSISIDRWWMVFENARANFCQSFLWGDMWTHHGCNHTVRRHNIFYRTKSKAIRAPNRWRDSIWMQTVKLIRPFIWIFNFPAHSLKCWWSMPTPRKRLTNGKMKLRADGLCSARKLASPFKMHR